MYYFPFLGIDSAGKNQLKAVTQGLAALIVCQVEELKSSDDMKLQKAEVSEKVDGLH